MKKKPAKEIVSEKSVKITMNGLDFELTALEARALVANIHKQLPVEKDAWEEMARKIKEHWKEKPEPEPIQRPVYIPVPQYVPVPYYPPIAQPQPLRYPGHDIWC